MSSGINGGQVTLDVVGDASKFGPQVASDIEGKSGGLFTGLGKKVGGLVLSGFAAIGIGTAIGDYVKSGIDEYKQFDAMNAQFQQSLANGGAAAGLTKKGMDDLATSVAGYSGQAVSSIGKTEQILAGFHAIKNVGTNKVFDDTTVAAANLAAHFGGDASSSALKLGRALSDPVKGMTALRRVGVTFTDGQQKTIKSLVDSGNLLGAQKMILQQVHAVTGDAAQGFGQTLPGAIARTHVALGEMNRTLVTAFLPVLTPIINGLADKINTVAIPAVEKLTQSIVTKGVPRFQAMAAAVKNVLAVLGGAKIDIGPWTQPVEMLGNVFRRVFAAIGSGAPGAFHLIVTALASFGTALAPVITAVFKFVAAVSPLGAVLKGFGPVLPSIIGLISKLASSLGGALISALTTLTPSLSALAKVITSTVTGALRVLIPIISDVAKTMADLLSHNSGALTSFIGVLANVATAILSFIQPLVTCKPLVEAIVIAFLAWKAINVIVNLTTMAMGVFKAVQIGVTAASYGLEGATYATTAASKAAFIATNILNGAYVRQAIVLAQNAAANIGAAVKTAAAWVGAKVQIIASFVATAAASAANGAKAAVVWVAQAAKAVAAWVAAKVQIIASFVASAAASALNGAKVAAVWVAQAGKAAAAWVLAKVQIIASFVASAAAAVANGARMALVWVAQKAAVLGYIAVQGLLKAAQVAATVAQWALNVAMDANPIGLIVIAIAALVAGLIWFFTQTKLGQQIWAGFVAFLQAAWKGLVAVAQVVWQAILTAISTVVKWISTFFQLEVKGWTIIFNTVFNAIKTVVTNVINGVKTIINTVIGWISVFIKANALVWHTVFTTAFNIIKTVVTNVINAVKAVINTVLGWIKAYITLTVKVYSTIFTTVFNAIKLVVTTVINAVKTVITTVINAVRTFITDRLNAIHTTFTHIWNLIHTATTVLFNAIRTVTTNVINGVRTFITNALNTIHNIWTNTWNTILAFLKTVFHNIVTAVTTAITTVIGFFKALPGRIISAIGNAGAMLLNVGKQIIQGLMNGITGMAKNVVGAVQNVVGGAINAAKSLLGIASPSKVFMAFGGFVGKGLHLGIDRMRDKVAASAGALAKTVTNSFGKVMPSLSIASNITAGKLAALPPALTVPASPLGKGVNPASLASVSSAVAAAHAAGTGASIINQFNGHMGYTKDEVVENIVIRQRRAQQKVRVPR